ncbi:hypothetical protein CHU98_g10668 [Xylaria longipes]|nr:hypothetical protein CHU98_g10668 [Xylaria longipes]
MQEPWVGNVFSSVDSWNSDGTRPRSLIYVRKHLRADQLRPYRTRDITWVKVRGITFVSVYRPSDDPMEVDEILEAWTPPFGCVMAGDFNAGDSSWDMGNPDYHGGAALAGVMYGHGLDLISEPYIPTHDGGNVLDLAFSDVPMAEAIISEALHSTSDHETLRIDPNKEKLDQFAKALVDIIQGAKVVQERNKECGEPRGKDRGPTRMSNATN